MDQEQLQQGKCRAFDCYCKKVLRNEARNIYAEDKRRRLHEVSLFALTSSELRQLFVLDKYFADYHVFNVLGREVVVMSAWIADALAELPTRRRDILLMSYYLGMPDRLIGDKLGIGRGTAQYQRKRALAQMRELMEGGQEDGL
jgi:RNA polymerase sigma factor (sigma-70 family)